MTAGPREVIIPSGEVRLAGTLVLPEASPPVATVILLPGSGHHDRDETIGLHRPFAVVADHLAMAGFASLRFDGRGMGQSGGTIEQVDFASKVADALAARRWLVERARMAEERIAFVGHSEGGLVGAAAAAEMPTPLAMLAGPAEPVADTLHALAEVESRVAGATPAQIAHERAMNMQAFAIAAASGTPRREELVALIAARLTEWPDTPAPAAPEDLRAAAETMADTLLAPDFRSLLQQEPSRYLARLAAPVIALFGEVDRQVNAASNLAAFQVATASNRAATAVVLPGHNHLFQVALTGEIGEYASLGSSPSPQALAELVCWLNDVFASV